MKSLRSRKYLLALIAILFVFAGCKGESPTAPPPGSGPGGNPGGGNPPATSTTLALTASNTSPQVNSSTTLTATVTVNGSPAPNGTAVEFAAFPIGRFEDTGLPTTVRVTTNGVATAVLTSAAAGTTTVTAVVGSAARQISISFGAGPVIPPPPDTVASISAIAPTSGVPAGGQIITITGRNFRTPVRVFFDLGGGVLREATVASVTPTQIQVFTPQVDLGSGQQLAATIVVFVEAGTPNEQRITSSAFTFQQSVLTPIVTTLSPASGPIEGGTRITIFGEGFEAPIQVFFGSAEAQIINTTFSQLIVVSPPGRDTSPDGTIPATGTVPLRIININSNTTTTFATGFRYSPAMAIIAALPTAGSALGGTRIEIDGIGFDDPVSITVGEGVTGATLQPVFVSGTKIIAVTSPLASPCSTTSGPIRVTNINTGIFAVGPVFSFIPVVPVITGVTAGGPIQPGTTVSVTVNNPGVGALGTAFPRFTINGRTIPSTPSTITSGTGNQVFSLVVPTTGFTFPTVACTTASLAPGTQLAAVEVPLTFNNISNGCAAEPTTITVNPPGANTCLTPPTASVSPAAPTCANVGTIPSAGTTTGSATISITNAAGAQPLIISNASVTGTGATFTISPTATTILAGTTTNFTLIADATCTPVLPAVTCPITGNVTFTTNDPTRGSIGVCVTGSGQ